MIRMRLGYAVGLFVAAGMLTLAAGGEARAERGARIGPVYSSPEAIRFVQRILERDHLLAPGAAQPGELDQPTIDAIRRFQRAHFLRPSGRIDPDTMGMMTAHGLAGTETAPATGATARRGGAADRRGGAPAGTNSALVMPQTDAPPPLAWAAPPRPAYARLRVPRLGIDAPVVEGTDAASLALGPGHMAGSAAPGAAGNCVIAGHRSGVLGRIHELRAGDRIEVAGPAGEAAYRVGAIEVVGRDDVRPLRATGSPVLTLITCHPLRYAGPAPQRLVVRADRVESPLGAAFEAGGRLPGSRSPVRRSSRPGA